MKKEYNIGPDNVVVKSTTNVTFHEYFTLSTPEGTLDLKVDITAELVDIPEKYHEVMLNMLSSKYINKVSFTSNPFSRCNLPEKKKWWNFWKDK